MQRLMKIGVVIEKAIVMKNLLLTCVALACAFSVFPQSTNKSRVAVCEPPAAYGILDINNVRTRINSGGDMWWDLLGDPAYEIPKGSGSHSVFAGALWMGGYDANDVLHLMAQRFRQVGQDAYTGPLIVSGEDQALTDKQTCRDFDKIFELLREDVVNFRAWWECSQNPNCNTEAYFPGYVIPQSILNWPAHGPQGGYSYYLAPFYDVNEDGLYNPYDGDFPYFEFPEDGITDNPDCLDTRDLAPKLYGDQTLWWVYNDAGNEHGETGGEPLGVEVHAQAFAYADQGVLNDQTFYQYQIINRSTHTYHNFRVGLWTDADLGGATDDRIGCDVQRGLGYMYNGDDFDDDSNGNSGYGANPPAVGFDFVSGLFLDLNTTDDPSNWDTVAGVRVLDCTKADFMNGNINGQNFADGIVDNERWGMNHFMFFTCSGGGSPYTTSPGTALEYYNYLQTVWKDNSPMYYGATGHLSGGANTDVEANFMFPGSPTTDQCGWGQNGQVMDGWSEESEGYLSDDRRFVMSMEAITLQPGETNNFTVATVWARGNDGPQSSVAKLKKVDDAVQAMFDRCFRVLDGPDQPELTIVELDSKLIFHISNTPASNNYLEEYEERDESLICDDCDRKYRFQGYQVFQLKSPDVDFFEERYNPDMVQEIFQCDIRDEVENLVNYKYNADWSSLSDQLEVEAANEGIKHSFELKKDAFPFGESDRLVNHKEMYFVVLAYASNTDFLYSPFDQTHYFGQKTPYLTSRKTPVVYTAVAHKPDAEQGGTELTVDYEDGLPITQVEGYGNGNNLLKLSDSSYEKIMSGSPWRIDTVTYCAGNGPVKIRIIDPLNVKADDFTLGVLNDYGIYWSYGRVKESAKWYLLNSEGDTLYLENEIGYLENEILLPDYGISIEWFQVDAAGYRNRNPQQNGMLSATMQYENPEADWLHFIQDGEGLDEYNWIRSGTYQSQELEDPDFSYADFIGFDPDQNFEQILGGTWAPYVFASTFKYGPAYNTSKLGYIRNNIHKYYQISSVEIVITPDKDKWSRALVLEMCENEWTVDEAGNPIEVDPLVNYRSEGNALRFDMRQHASVDKDGNVIPGDTTHGLSWFPGYAIDVRTGERLNIAFGEDSWLVGENGNDMMWNPTNSQDTLDGPMFGGKHYIYVYGSNQESPDPTLPALQTTYDSCAYVYGMMRSYEETGLEKYKVQALSGIMWTAIPLWNTAYNFLDNEVKIKLSLANPYYRTQGEYAVENAQNDNLPLYKFSTRNYIPNTNDVEIAKTALDLIRVVPNPYYGYSFYQASSTERKVKITNLPQQCVVSIYDPSGRLIKRWDKHYDPSWIEWDLTDNAGDRIGGGMYIVHIDAPNIGEKVVKWFGALSE